MTQPALPTQSQTAVFCSVIIPTIGRDKLTRAVESVLAQEVNETFEVIVVNDSGQPLSKEAWQKDGRVQIIDTNKRERCVARNTGAALAHGRYLHFLDDDDWLLPGAFNALRQTAQAQPEAAWIYGTANFIDPDGNPVGTINFERNGNCFTQTVAGAWIPLQASWIQTEAFFAVGGFPPLIHVTQDLALAQRIALQGDFAHTKATIAMILRSQGAWGSSTNYNLGPQWVRWSRNYILGQAGAFQRLLDSADTPFWHGRVFHAYLTTALYNLKQKRILTAASRGLYGTAALAAAGPHLLAGQFWRALKVHHVGRDFH